MVSQTTHANEPPHPLALAGIAIGALRRSPFVHPSRWSSAAIKVSERTAKAVPRAEVTVLLSVLSAHVATARLASMLAGEILVYLDVPSVSPEAEARHIKKLCERHESLGVSSSEMLLNDQGGGRTRLAFVYPLRNALERYYADRGSKRS